jgi:hypothetical protein
MIDREKLPSSQRNNGPVFADMLQAHRLGQQPVVEERVIISRETLLLPEKSIA